MASFESSVLLNGELGEKDMKKIKRDKAGYEYDSDDFHSENLARATALTKQEMAAMGLPLKPFPIGRAYQTRAFEYPALKEEHFLF